MHADDARELLDYNGWANRRLLDASSRLPPDDFARDLRTSFGSIKGTLVHILDSEQVWLDWWQSKPRPPQLEIDAFAGPAALAAAFAALEGEQRAFVGRLTDESLRSSVLVKDRRYTLARLITHALSHSQYHRGQVASLLRQLGQAPPNTGFRTGFLDERGWFEET